MGLWRASLRYGRLVGFEACRVLETGSFHSASSAADAFGAYVEAAVTFATDVAETLFSEPQSSTAASTPSMVPTCSGAESFECRP